jgi:hypothetical protein
MSSGFTQDIIFLYSDFIHVSKKLILQDNDEVCH